MRTDILIASCKRDLPWLRYALKSIKKFAHGFGGVTVVWPRAETEQFIGFEPGTLTQTNLVLFDEFPGKGMLDAMSQKMLADQHCPNANYVLHSDSDVVFKEPFGPEDYMVEGKPIWLVEPYEAIKARRDSGVGRYRWRSVTEDMLGFEVKYETMCWPQIICPVGLYDEYRKHIEKRWGMPMRHYYLTGRNEFPQDRAEFPSLGAYAREFHHDWFQWIDVSTNEPRPKHRAIQFWSHSDPDILQSTWIDGKEQIVMPKTMIEEILA